MSLESKKIVLTGGSSGIGKALLQLLLEEGALVVVGDLEPEKIPDHPNLHKIRADLASVKEIDSLIEQAIDRLDKIDIFIANAGFAYYEKIEKEDWERIQKIFTVNVFSPIYTAKKLNRLFPKGFHFVVTASAMSFLPLPGYALYSATKAAVQSFVRAFRFEVGKKSKLTVVYPIATKTSFFGRAGDQVPIPWPSQSPEVVARKILRAIQKRRSEVHPSHLFRTILILNRFFPFLLFVYQKWEERRFQAWHKKSA